MIVALLLDIKILNCKLFLKSNFLKKIIYLAVKHIQNFAENFF